MTLFVSSITIYYSIEIIHAKKVTQDVIIKGIKEKKVKLLDGSVHHLPLTLSQLTEQQKNCLIKVMDPGFYQHDGTDFHTPGTGLTTLTQALVKKLYFKRFKAGIAKIKQTLLAVFVLDPMVSKKDQLFLYINICYLGNVDGREIIGFEEASKSYYNKMFSDLTENEYLALVATLVAPNTFNIIDHPQWNTERVKRIKMLISGKYTPKGLMDQYYGPLAQEIIDAGLPVFSYFKSYYQN